MNTCPRCSAPLVNALSPHAPCGVCDRMERVRAAASLRRFRSVALRPPWRLRVPKAANGKPVAAQSESALPPSDRRE